jgi:hypothetical protein
MIRVVLPAHLRTLARIHGEVELRIAGQVFACEQDLSHDQPHAPLPDAVAVGTEPFLIVGAMAGG